MDPIQIAKLKEQLAKRYAADLAAIDRVAALIASSGKIPAGKKTAATNGRSELHEPGSLEAELDPLGLWNTIPDLGTVVTAGGSTVEAVRAVIEQRSGTFTTRDIQKELIKRFPHINMQGKNRRIYLGTVLKRMVKKKQVVVAKEHTSTSPTLYKKA